MNLLEYEKCYTPLVSFCFLNTMRKTSRILFFSAYNVCPHISICLSPPPPSGFCLTSGTWTTFFIITPFKTRPPYLSVLFSPDLSVCVAYHNMIGYVFSLFYYRPYAKWCKLIDSRNFILCIIVPTHFKQCLSLK